MKWKGWDHAGIRTDDGGNADAIAPLIISASRSTDIPAFYGDWFASRLAEGYVRWKSPFGGKPMVVSFEKARVFVFWSKNPAPFERHLATLDRMGYRYYFLLTLNDYDTEGLEPNVPPLDERIATFIRLSERLGKGRVVWRFDPLLLSDSISVGTLLERIRRTGEQIHPFTERMVFSFVEIARYPKVQRNLTEQHFTSVREFTEEEVAEFCEGLSRLNESWGLTVTACADRRDLSRYGIGRGQCISYDLMVREFGDDRLLMEFLTGGGQTTITRGSTADPARRLKDPGQRSSCRCIVSKDIGQYATCPHLCAYCYANSSAAAVRKNYAAHLSAARQGNYRDTIAG
jgi:DNA repair photolyase